MKQTKRKQFLQRIALFCVPFVSLLAFLLVFCSFKTARLTDDFFKQLGLTKEAASDRITGGLLNGYITTCGIKNVKNLAFGDRKALVLDLLWYAREQANSDAFLKKYNELREQYKPKLHITPTPEQERAVTIANAKAALAKMEAAQQKSGPQYKAIFDDAIESAKENLRQQEDPTNKSRMVYARNYPGLVKTFAEDYARQLADWEKRYPANQHSYVKMRLLEWLEATKDIDFNAELITRKNGTKYFANPACENKNGRWKMAFRAGRDVVEPARDFVQKWIAEIK